MGKIENQTHNKETFLYAASKMFERASYYGLRSLVVLYMVGEVLKMSHTDALSIYGWFTASIVFSHIIGAILGDLVIGNKKAIIIGGVTYAIGAYCLCIPSVTGFFIGIFLVVLGGGLFAPNLTSKFGILYLNKTRLLDAGFTIFYLSVYLGSFIGVISIGYLAKRYGFNVGFIVAGSIMLLSVIPMLFSKEKKIELTTEKKSKISRRVIFVSIAFVFVGLFWTTYELGNIWISDLQLNLSETSALNIPKSMWKSLNSVFTLPIGILAIVLWTFFYSNQFFKLTIGSISCAISFGILFLLPEMPTEQRAVLYIASMVMLSISEIHIAPLIHSILTQYSNPKYLAILISLAFIPTRLFTILMGLFNEELNKKPVLGIFIGIIAMTILSIGLLVFYRINKKASYTTVKYI